MLSCEDCFQIKEEDPYGECEKCWDNRSYYDEDMHEHEDMMNAE